MEKLTGEQFPKVFNSQGEEILDPRNYQGLLYNEKKQQICGAKSKQKDWVCMLLAGHGTDHKGTGKCKFHGGSSKGAPKQNTNAVKHGIYKTIWVDKLDQTEKDYYDNQEIDKIAEIDSHIKLTNIRIRDLMTTKQRYDSAIIAMMINQQTMTKHDYIRRTEIETLIPIIEQELTKLQTNLIRMIDEKHKLELDDGISTEQAELNKKSFLEAAKQEPDLFDDIEPEDGDFDGEA